MAFKSRPVFLRLIFALNMNREKEKYSEMPCAKNKYLQ